MKVALIVLLATAVVAARVAIYRRRRTRRPADTGAPSADRGDGREASMLGGLGRWRDVPWIGDVGTIAGREIRERVRGRIFRAGTLVILAAVAAAIIIPTIHKGGGRTTQTVGVVGGLSAPAVALVKAAASRTHEVLELVSEPSLSQAEVEVRSGKLDLAIVEGKRILINQPLGSSASPADSSFVQYVSEYLGLLDASRAAGLTPAQATQLSHSTAAPVQSLEISSKSATRSTSVIGIVLLFLMLTQYNTWILIGVMQEKSSRVVEVLLATVRPLQLLGGKVLGIGLVALGQAALIVGFALVVARAVGSSLLHGTAPLVLACDLLWLVLGYAFYCWMYAAAGSTAERQDQVQTLALPLSIPILVGYVFSITVASTGNPSTLFRVLAFLPPTAPFCMSVLVGLSQVTWWEFVLSVLITVAGTAGMAIFAARIYRRAVLRTGGRVRIRELVVGHAD